jgi:hypothetical protein
MGLHTTSAWKNLNIFRILWQEALAKGQIAELSGGARHQHQMSQATGVKWSAVARAIQPRRKPIQYAMKTPWWRTSKANLLRYATVHSNNLWRHAKIYSNINIL